jgi:hypothetical protein
LRSLADRFGVAVVSAPKYKPALAFSKRTLKSGDTDSGDKLGLFLINWHITISGQNAVAVSVRFHISN